MYKGLYNTFKHWYDGGQVYFYADPHFGDEDMKYIRKNYIGDEEQIKHINSKVGKKDTLVILGDIGDIKCVQKLKGRKILICGNHDMGATKYQRHMEFYFYDDKDRAMEALKNRKICQFREDGYNYTTQCHEYIGWSDNRLFDEVYEGCLMISENIILSHEQVNFPYALNIHGHDHSYWAKDDELHLNVCAEHINYTPVSLKEIIESGKLKNIPNIHRQTIDRATDRRKLAKGILKELENGKA